MARKNRKWKKSRRKKPEGWRNEPQRHACSAYGIKTAHARQDSMFFPAEHENLSKVITIESPEEARKSLDELDEIFENAPEGEEGTRREGYVTKGDIIHAVQLASNRAEAMREREHLSEKEDEEMKEVAQIYDEWVDEHEMTADGRWEQMGEYLESEESQKDVEEKLMVRETDVFQEPVETKTERISRLARLRSERGPITEIKKENIETELRYDSQNDEIDWEVMIDYNHNGYRSREILDRGSVDIPQMFYQELTL